MQLPTIHRWTAQYVEPMRHDLLHVHQQVLGIVRRLDIDLEPLVRSIQIEQKLQVDAIVASGPVAKILYRIEVFCQRFFPLHSDRVRVRVPQACRGIALSTPLIEMTLEVIRHSAVPIECGRSSLARHNRAPRRTMQTACSNWLCDLASQPGASSANDSQTHGYGRGRRLRGYWFASRSRRTPTASACRQAARA